MFKMNSAVQEVKSDLEVSGLIFFAHCYIKYIFSR